MLKDIKELKEIIEGCEKNNRIYQEKLYKLLYQPIFKKCRLYASSTAEAEDFFHDSMIKIFANLHQYKYKGNFEGWCRHIAKNHIIDKIRKNKVEFLEDVHSEAKIQQLTDDEFEYNEIIKVELSADVILSALSLITPKRRAIFNMRVMEGMGHNDIAKTLNISAGTSKSQYFKAMKTIRQVCITYINTHGTLPIIK